MDFSFFITGLIIGLTLAMPVGPMSILCISRTLSGGLGASLPVMIGTGLGDVFFSIIAVFGLVQLTDFFIAQKYWFSLFGAVLLLMIAFNLMRGAKNIQLKNDLKPRGVLKEIPIFFFLTLTNPLTIITYTAMIASFGFARLDGNIWGGFYIVLGVFTGTFLWFFCLALMSHFLKKKFGTSFFKYINYLATMLLLGFAGKLLLSL